VRVRPLRRSWEPLEIVDLFKGSPGAHARTLEAMNDVLALWAGTKYGSGQSCRGVLANCTGFIFGAIDDLDGRPRSQAPSMPDDAALHNPAGATAALFALRELYNPVQAVMGPVQPFDILVVSPAGAGPSHVMLVGTQPGHLWHCTPASGVHRGGWALGEGYERLHGAFRISDRWRWLR